MKKLRLVSLFIILSTLAVAPARADATGIGGTVTDALSAAPLSDVCVTAYSLYTDPEWGDEWWEESAWTTTNQDGAYFLGLNEGTYRVGFYQCYEDSPQYISEFFDNENSVWDADDVTVTADQTTVVNAGLDLGGSITGTVTDPSGDVLPNICVSARAADDEEDYAGWGYTSEDGTYTVFGLRGGSYKLRFSDCEYASFKTEWYQDKTSFTSADPVVVVSGVATPSIDVSLVVRERPDVAVTDILVSPVPLQTDSTELPSPGTVRRVTVKASNVGAAANEYANIVVWAVSETDGNEQWIGSIDTDGLAPGDDVERTFKWNGFGTLGDVTIHAQSCNYDDPNHLNDHRQTESYAVVGGTGFGIRPALSDYIYCDEYYWD